MEYFSIVYSISLGKSDTPCCILKWEGEGSGHHTGKEELQKVRHTIVERIVVLFFFFQLHLVTPLNKRHIFFFEILQMICFRRTNNIEDLWISVLFLGLWAS